MYCGCVFLFFFFSSRRRHTRCSRDWSSDVCSSDLHRDGEWVEHPTELQRCVAELQPIKIEGGLAVTGDHGECRARNRKTQHHGADGQSGRKSALVTPQHGCNGRGEQRKDRNEPENFRHEKISPASGPVCPPEWI